MSIVDYAAADSKWPTLDFENDIVITKRVHDEGQAMKLRRAFLLIVALACLAIGANGASSHQLPPWGGSWSHQPGNYLTLGYSIASANQPAGYTTAINGAMRAWYDAPTEVWPYPTTYANSVVDFYIDFWSDLDPSVRGITYVYPCWGNSCDLNSNRNTCMGSGCTFHYAQIYINRTAMDNAPIFQTQKTAAHEFGHAVGLSHWCNTAPPCGFESTNASIMFSGDLPYDVPQNHDINDVNAIYP